MDKKIYENRYWLVNDDVFELHFTRFYNDEIILSFTQDKEDAETFWYTSEFLKVEQDTMDSSSVEEAMTDFEDLIIEHIEEEIGELEELLERFKEEKG